MGLTTAMFTGLTGLNASQFAIDTIGNNVSNVNTTAYKGSRANFENQFSLMLSPGSGPGETTGGTNPSQLGLGAMVSGTQKDFSSGAIETTALPTDLAIEGAGFFILRTSDGSSAYTRDGTFQVSADQTLVSSDGSHVQGYGVDANYNVVPGTLGNISIPLGTLSAAKATTKAEFDGNLNADGDVATQGTILQSQTLHEGSAAGATASETTLLTNLYDAGSGANPLFAAGDVLTLDGITKGGGNGRELPEATFEVTATSTLADLATFLTEKLAINTEDALAGNPGARIGTVGSEAGQIIIEGNAGTENALKIELADIRNSNTNFPTPFQFTEAQAADGESASTTFVVYDTLGSPARVGLTAVLDSTSSLGTTWRFYTESYDDTDASPVLGPTGTISFDNNGQLTGATNNSISIDRDNTGAADPLQFEIDFSGLTALASPNASSSSTMVMTTQDGYPMGTLSNFSVGKDGVVMGTFSNGLSRPLGQIALATFTNPEGLVADVNNLYRIGPNSGQPVVTTPQTLGAGSILGGALEMSNVDLTREFIGLISASTAFSANGRVISTSSDLLNELLSVAR